MESTIVAIFLGVAGMVACLLFVVKPLWPASGTHRQSWRASTVWSDWLDRKETLLFNLEDLEHEQRLGKISQEDFSRLQGSYKKQWVGVLDQMDNAKPPADFEAFLTLPGVTTRARQQAEKNKDARGERACFSCKMFFEEEFKFCPQCGAALTVRS